MSTTHRYQVVPDLSPEEYAALKADIDANGVKIPIEVDEEENIIDGFHRKQICDELEIEYPKRVLIGLTEAQKLEHAWRVNLMRRHLTREQKIELAGRWWKEGWTQERIAQALGVSQPTIVNWLPKVINSDDLTNFPTVEGKDGRRQPCVKGRRREAKPTEANRREKPQNPSHAGGGSAQGLALQEPLQPHNTRHTAQAPSSEPPAAADAPDAPERPSPVSDEWHPVPVEQAGPPLGSSPTLPAGADAAAHWVDALQDLSETLETLQVQGGLLPASTDWAPDTRARGMATIRHMKEIFIGLEAVVGAEMDETADRNGHADATSLPGSLPIEDEVQKDGNRELGTVSSAEAPVGDVAGGDQLPSQKGGEGSPPCEPVPPGQEEEKPPTQLPPTTPSKPARGANRKQSPGRTRTRQPKQTVANGQGSGVPVQLVPDHMTPDDSQSEGEEATSGISAPHHDEDTVAAAVDGIRPIGVSAPATDDDSVPGDRTRCGWCGGTQFFHIFQSGEIFCECRSVYNPSKGRWAPGDTDKQQSPPVSVPATGFTMQGEIDRGTSEAIAGSTVGGGVFGDENTVHQGPPAGPRDDGETHQSERREIA